MRNGGPLLFFYSGALALLIQTLFFYFLFYFIFEDVKLYGSINEEATISIDSIELEVALDDEENKEASHANPKAGTGVQDAFKEIFTQDAPPPPPKKEILNDNRYELVQNAQKRLEELTKKTKQIKEQYKKIDDVVIKNSSSSKNVKYDVWFAEVEKILYFYWNRSRSMLPDNLVALVGVYIDQNGHATFLVKRYSGYPSFDSALDALIAELRDYTFPPPPSVISRFNVEFKTNITN